MKHMRKKAIVKVWERKILVIFYEYLVIADLPIINIMIY